MSITTLIVTCLWLLLVSNITAASDANVNCLRSIYSQVKDPNGYLSSWVFRNKSFFHNKSYAYAGYICKFNGLTCWHDDENRVLSIKLAGYGLIGEFPLGIKQCSDLTGLDLSGNNFSGPLPSNIVSLIPLVTVLDLSDNSFSREIPASLSNISFLNTLKLQHNQFTGPLPPELVQIRRLTKFSVADNRLTGPIPTFNQATFKMEANDFANNIGLCGLPMDACVDPEEMFISLGKFGAAVGAALFAPVGAFLHWFFFIGRKEKQGGKRHRIFHIGD